MGKKVRAIMKEKKHLPLYGPGPIYGAVSVCLTVLFCILSGRGYLSSGIFPQMKTQFIITGIILIILAVMLWIKAVIIDKIDDNIINNKLKTTGAYAWVRNPIYTAVLMVCTGVLFICGNVWGLLLPVFIWLFLSALLKFTEEKWLSELYGDEYKEYCRNVNRVIPWFDRRSRKKADAVFTALLLVLFVPLFLTAAGRSKGRYDGTMTIHEFGTENEEVIVLVHPSVVRWDYFEYVIPYLEKDYHLIIPAQGGYDPDKENDFPGVEQTAADLENWLNDNGYHDIKALYGCSMGGAVALKMTADGMLNVEHTIIDGGITPYQMPWLLTRYIAVRDTAEIAIGKMGGEKLLASMFTTDEYSDEDMKYIADVLRMMSFRTMWQTFDSCNNYDMPEGIINTGSTLTYWCAETEQKEREWDMDYVRMHFPDADIRIIDDVGHGGLATLYPEKFDRMMRDVIGEEGNKNET